MTNQKSDVEPMVAPRALSISTAVLAVLALVQFGLGIGAMGSGGVVANIHGGFGYLALVVAVVTAVFTFLWTRRVGHQGLFWHAVSLPVLAVVQIGLANTGLVAWHIVIGIFYVVAVIALFMLVRKRSRA